MECLRTRRRLQALVASWLPCSMPPPSSSATTTSSQLTRMTKQSVPLQQQGSCPIQLLHMTQMQRSLTPSRLLSLTRCDFIKSVRSTVLYQQCCFFDSDASSKCYFSDITAHSLRQAHCAHTQ